ncbi:MAG: porphobilinogen synthase [Nitrososphaerota archaeon]|jgi:porphobilinogen synthase|nr:porphobilinogen synthase [Nitrososphaerota archaeon]MDG6970117.1 porphobilinogen synthase [Nitrososphaerota archaeon]MDG6984822.1 porphobilinogen synthase [Nitrososphaerota archaeon]MDG6992390.1 porphobilinogen synthase [Nitrososphaerota archaeon]MDG7003369.1 porphobilinogen synthase [Nitrososphaerota archaeon]
MSDEPRVRPERRGRRLRRTEPMRRMLDETRLHKDMFVAPVFVVEGEGRAEEIDGMPGVLRYSVDRLPTYFERLVRAGIRSVLLFGVPGHKDDQGTGAYARDGIVPRAMSSIRQSFPELVVMADVCLCEYTSHGHCGVLRGREVDNDGTLPLLSRAAVEYARSGADVVAPSAMMDGQVLAIRRALDEAGFDDAVVMGYSAKHASAFYGPFRNAAGSAPSFGDRRGYQMQPGNRREALREVEEDIREGADIVMVKPALAYLDVISEARRRFEVPLAAYNVSGEYSMLKAAALNGWLDEKSAAREVLTGIRRAGADLIITYFAEQAAGWIKEGW